MSSVLLMKLSFYIIMYLKFSLQSFKNSTKILLFCISLFGYGLISLLVTDGNDSRQITIPYRLFILLLSLVVIILSNYNICNGHKNNQHYYTKAAQLSPILILTFIFIVTYSCRLVYETGYNTELVKTTDEYLLTWFGVCLLPGFSFLYVDFKNLEKYLYPSWLLLAISSTVALPLLILQGGKVFIEQGRLAGEALNSISLGHQSASLILISLYILLNKKAYKFKFKSIKLLFLLALLIGNTLLFLAASKGALIATIICILLLFISIKRKGNSILGIVIAIIIGFIFINIASSFAIDSGSLFLERFSSFIEAKDFVDTKFVQRPELYQKATELISEYPIFGYGLEVPNLTYPHNLILEAFLSTGLFGGFLFLIIYVYTVIKAVTMIMDKKSLWGWLGLIYIQYSIAAMFSGALYSSYIFWYLFLAIVGFKKTKLNIATQE